MHRKTIGAILAGAATLVLAIPAVATPTISITAPAEGGSVSRSASGFALDLAGTVAFDQPEASTKQFFVRRTACTADQRLSVEQGTETAACASNNSNTPLNEVDRIPTVYAAADGLPFTLDASRPANGVVTLTSFQQPAYAGAGQTIVDIALSGTTGGSNVDLGTTTVEYLAIPGQPPTSTPWTITLPASADKEDFTAFSLSLTVRGLHVTHGYVRPNATHLTLPTYTASFGRKVEVALDDRAFSAMGITLGADFTSWSGLVPMPPEGSHVIKARAVQGGVASPATVNTFTVTA